MNCLVFQATEELIYLWHISNSSSLNDPGGLYKSYKSIFLWFTKSEFDWLSYEMILMFSFGFWYGHDFKYSKLMWTTLNFSALAIHVHRNSM